MLCFDFQQRLLHSFSKSSVGVCTKCDLTAACAVLWVLFAFFTSFRLFVLQFELTARFGATPDTNEAVCCNC